MHPLILSLLGQTGISVAGQRSLRRTTPAARPASASMADMARGYKQRVQDTTGNDPLPIQLNQNKPTPYSDLINEIKNAEDPAASLKKLETELGGSNMASIQGLFHREADGSVNPRTSKRGGYAVNINPNVSEELFAHELGHAASSQTKFGDAINRMRSVDPKLAQAIAMGGGLTALGAAALNPGDDDLGAAILGTTALAAPTLIDEALASKNALAIMNNAGRPATLGQKGRLAGAFMTYLAAPASTAVLANTLGNQFDEDI